MWTVSLYWQFLFLFPAPNYQTLEIFHTSYSLLLLPFKSAFIGNLSTGIQGALQPLERLLGALRKAVAILR